MGINSKKKSTSKTQVMQEGFLEATTTVVTCMHPGKTGKEDTALLGDPSFTSFQTHVENKLETC